MNTEQSLKQNLNTNTSIVVFIVDGNVMPLQRALNMGHKNLHVHIMSKFTTSENDIEKVRNVYTFCSNEAEIKTMTATQIERWNVQDVILEVEKKLKEHDTDKFYISDDHKNRHPLKNFNCLNH